MVKGQYAGEKHPQAKLDWKRVREIRQARDISFTELGRIYGVARRTISDIVYYRTWFPAPPEQENG